MGPLEESVAALGPPALPGNRCRDSGPGSPAAAPFGAQQLKQLHCAPVWRVPASQSGALQSSLSLPLQYQATVPENEVGVLVARLSVSDRDKQGSPAWQAKYKIVRGNEGGFFTITTDPNNNNGVLETSQGLDFEVQRQFILNVIAMNDIPFSVSLPTSTATVTVNVEDVNKAPVFDPPIKSLRPAGEVALGTGHRTLLRDPGPACCGNG
ncbi:B-cadherin-like [Caretta caretta]|uniref:B-cadherin-like n=1 Tax=Caretta caretta TaxID=8467 RepID=UPI003F4CA2EB